MSCCSRSQESGSADVVGHSLVDDDDDDDDMFTASGDRQDDGRGGGRGDGDGNGDWYRVESVVS